MARDFGVLVGAMHVDEAALSGGLFLLGTIIMSLSVISMIIFACSEGPRKRRDSYGGGGGEGGGDDGGGVQDGGHHHQHHHASHHHAVPVTTITITMPVTVTTTPVTMLFPCIATITTNKYEYCMNVYLTIHLWCFKCPHYVLYIYIYIYKSSVSSLSVIYFGLSSQFLFQICVSSFN